MSRAATLSQTQREFVLAAQALGAGTGHILLRHLLPNIAPPLLAYTLFMMAVMIAAEGTLNFLGLGVPPPTPSWGGMIADGRDYLGEAPHISLLPVAAIGLTVLAFNVLSETLREHAAAARAPG